MHLKEDGIVAKPSLMLYGIAVLVLVAFEFGFPLIYSGVNSVVGQSPVQAFNAEILKAISSGSSPNPLQVYGTPMSSTTASTTSIKQMFAPAATTSSASSTTTTLIAAQPFVGGSSGTAIIPAVVTTSTTTIPSSSKITLAATAGKVNVTALASPFQLSGLNGSSSGTCSGYQVIRCVILKWNTPLNFTAGIPTCWLSVNPGNLGWLNNKQIVSCGTGSYQAALEPPSGTTPLKYTFTLTYKANPATQNVTGMYK